MQTQTRFLSHGIIYKRNPPHFLFSITLTILTTKTDLHYRPMSFEILHNNRESQSFDRNTNDIISTENRLVAIFVCKYIFQKYVYATNALSLSYNVSLENLSNVDNLSKLSKRQIILTVTGRVNAVKENNIRLRILTQIGHYFIFKLLLIIFTFKISILFY